MLYRSVAYSDGLLGVDGDDGITDHGALHRAMVEVVLNALLCTIQPAYLLRPVFSFS